MSDDYTTALDRVIALEKKLEPFLIFLDSPAMKTIIGWFVPGAPSILDEVVNMQLQLDHLFASLQVPKPAVLPGFVSSDAEPAPIL